MNPSPDQIRSRQTAYLATEAWWKTRVEALRDSLTPASKRFTTDYEQGYDDALLVVADKIDALLTERPSRCA